MNYVTNSKTRRGVGGARAADNIGLVYAREPTADSCEQISLRACNTPLTEGNAFYRISSPSLDLVLEVERRYYTNASRIISFVEPFPRILAIDTAASGWPGGYRRFRNHRTGTGDLTAQNKRADFCRLERIIREYQVGDCLGNPLRMSEKKARSRRKWLNLPRSCGRGSASCPSVG